MYIIDPLKIKIKSLIQEGTLKNPLKVARIRYGTEVDFEAFKNTSLRKSRNNFFKFTDKLKNDYKNYIFIDFSPFARIGHLDKYCNFISSFDSPIPIILVSDNEFYSDLKAYSSNNKPLTIFKFNDENKFIEYYSDLNTKTDINIIESISKSLTSTDEKNHLLSLRKHISQELLISLLYKAGCIEVPFSNSSDSTSIYGKYYKNMPNGMLVSCYLNLKKFGLENDYLVDLAYEIVITITDHFHKDKVNLDHFDYLVVANNTALFLASSVQIISGINIVAIDKLGPIPALKLRNQKVYDILTNKRIILLEEVMATGSEVDRAAIFLTNFKAEISKIIALYNLEVGAPLLVDTNTIISLCKPKAELKYEYRSA